MDKRVVDIREYRDEAKRRTHTQITYSDGSKETVTSSDRYRQRTITAPKFHATPIQQRFMDSHDDRPEDVFMDAWNKVQDDKKGYKAIARQLGVVLGCDTPFAFKCFEFKLFQSRRVSISKALSMGLAEAMAYRSTKDASLQSVRMLMDCYTPDHSMFKIEGLSGLYRIVSLKELQKSPPDDCVFAIDVSLKRVMAYERIQDKIANAILDALEEAVDA